MKHYQTRAARADAQLQAIRAWLLHACRRRRWPTASSCSSVGLSVSINRPHHQTIRIHYTAGADRIWLDFHAFPLADPDCFTRIIQAVTRGQP